MLIYSQKNCQNTNQLTYNILQYYFLIECSYSDTGLFILEHSILIKLVSRI